MSFHGLKGLRNPGMPRGINDTSVLQETSVMNRAAACTLKWDLMSSLSLAHAFWWDF